MHLLASMAGFRRRIDFNLGYAFIIFSIVVDLPILADKNLIYIVILIFIAGELRFLYKRCSMFKALLDTVCGAVKGGLRANLAENATARVSKTTKLFCVLSILLLGGGIGLAPLRAEIVPYPENDPVFSVEVPDGFCYGI